MAIRNSVDHEAIFMKWINENLNVDRDAIIKIYTTD